MTIYKELLLQRSELDKQIDEARRVEVAEAARQVKILVQDFGLTAAQCGFRNVAASAVSARRPAKAKYITPDGKATWTGRGRPPKVFQALLDAGHQKEEFLI